MLGLDYVLRTTFTYIVVMVLGVRVFVEVFFEKKKTTQMVQIASYALYGLTYFVLRYSVIPYVSDNDIHDAFVLLQPVVLLIAIFLLTLNYEATKLKRLLCVLSFLVIMSLVQFLFYTIFMTSSVFEYVNLTGTEMSADEGLVVPADVFYVGQSIAFYLTALLLKQLKHLSRLRIKAPVFWISSFAILIFAFSLTAIALTQLPQGMSAVAILLVMLISIVTYYLMNGLANAHEQAMSLTIEQQEKKMYLAQNQLMLETIHEVKSVRHDMKLHLSALMHHIYTNPEEALSYIRELSGDIASSEVYSETGNTVLDGILNYKFKSAKADKIEVELDVFVPAELDVKSYDLMIILGNLLDNALEAVAKVEKKHIRVHIHYQQGNLFIKVENTFDGQLSLAEGTGAQKAGKLKRAKAGSEKAGKLKSIKAASDHGYGLGNIQKSVEKYNGIFHYHHEDNWFFADVMLYAGYEAPPTPHT